MTNGERQQAIEWFKRRPVMMAGAKKMYDLAVEALEQPAIIRCKDCKHWNLQVGNVKGDGLGSCDFHNVNLVTGEGFCYWADRRGGSDGTD